MASIIDCIEDIRAEVNDTATSHLVRRENLNGAIDSSNKVFYTQYYPITQITLTVDGISATGASFDMDKGIITLRTAPTTSVIADYYFNVFVDSDIEVWIDHGCKACGFDSISQLASIPAPMLGAVEHFAISMAMDAWARKYAEGFSWTVGPESVDKKDISANYRELAKSAYDSATQMRNDYYTRYGKREAPAYAMKQFHIRRYEPIR